MKILINGTSISAGTTTYKVDPNTQIMTSFQETWPGHLQIKLNCDMVNLSAGGAGNTYIHETTISEISQRSYDLVLIMWTEFNRTDIRVNDRLLCSSLDLTSRTQSKKNADNYFKDDVINDYIQLDWVFSGEYRNSDMNHPNSHVDKLFGHCDFSNSNIQMENSLIRIISLQGVLKSLNIPYRFLFYKPLVGQHRFHNLYKLIDWQNVFDDVHLFLLARNNNWWDDSTNHPTVEAYSAYADILADYLKNQELI
jgi:hypothetical protein